jgi:Protein of unknown function (DUF1236)
MHGIFSTGEQVMKKTPSHPIAVLLFVCASSFMGGSVQLAVAQPKPIEETVGHSDVQALDLTDAQKRAIYQEARKDRSKVAPSHFATHVGAEVPPMIALYPLPDAILDNDPVTKFYQFTRVEDQVVLVDPIKMRVVAVIGPKAGE